MLTQPNYAWFDKRVWKMPPYALALLNACLKKEYDVQLFDPNYKNMTGEEVVEAVRSDKKGNKTRIIMATTEGGKESVLKMIKKIVMIF